MSVVLATFSLEVQMKGKITPSSLLKKDCLIWYKWLCIKV
jgi:hypothetical protein